MTAEITGIFGTSISDELAGYDMPVITTTNLNTLEGQVVLGSSLIFQVGADRAKGYVPEQVVVRLVIDGKSIHDWDPFEAENTYKEIVSHEPLIESLMSAYKKYVFDRLDANASQLNVRDSGTDYNQFLTSLSNGRIKFKDIESLNSIIMITRTKLALDKARKSFIDNGKTSKRKGITRIFDENGLTWSDLPEDFREMYCQIISAENNAVQKYLASL